MIITPHFVMPHFVEKIQEKVSRLGKRIWDVIASEDGLFGLEDDEDDRGFYLSKLARRDMDPGPLPPSSPLTGPGKPSQPEPLHGISSSYDSRPGTLESPLPGGDGGPREAIFEAAPLPSPGPGDTPFKRFLKSGGGGRGASAIQGTEVGSRDPQAAAAGAQGQGEGGTQGEGPVPGGEVASASALVSGAGGEEEERRTRSLQEKAGALERPSMQVKFLKKLATAVRRRTRNSLKEGEEEGEEGPRKPRKSTLKGEEADKDLVAQCLLRLDTGVRICGFEEKRARSEFTADDILMIFSILGYTIIQYDLEMILEHSQIEVKELYSYREVTEAFLDMMDRNQASENKEEALVLAAFSYFDKDDSGAIDMHELEKAYLELGTALTDVDRQVLQSHSGKLTLRDFKEMNKGLDLAAEVMRRPQPAPREPPPSTRTSRMSRFIGLMGRAMSKKSSRSNDGRTPLDANSGGGATSVAAAAFALLKGSRRGISRVSRGVSSLIRQVSDDVTNLGDKVFRRSSDEGGGSRRTSRSRPTSPSQGIAGEDERQAPLAPRVNPFLAMRKRASFKEKVALREAEAATSRAQERGSSERRQSQGGAASRRTSGDPGVLAGAGGATPGKQSPVLSRSSVSKLFRWGESKRRSSSGSESGTSGRASGSNPGDLPGPSVPPNPRAPSPLSREAVPSPSPTPKTNSTGAEFSFLNSASLPKDAPMGASPLVGPPAPPIVVPPSPQRAHPPPRKASSGTALNIGLPAQSPTSPLLTPGLGGDRPSHWPALGVLTAIPSVSEAPGMPLPADKRRALFMAGKDLRPVEEGGPNAGSSNLSATEGEGFVAPAPVPVVSRWRRMTSRVKSGEGATAAGGGISGRSAASPKSSEIQGGSRMLRSSGSGVVRNFFRMMTRSDSKRSSVPGTITGPGRVVGLPSLNGASSSIKVVNPFAGTFRPPGSGEDLLKEIIRKEEEGTGRRITGVGLPSIASLLSHPSAPRTLEGMSSAPNPAVHRAIRNRLKGKTESLISSARLGLSFAASKLQHADAKKLEPTSSNMSYRSSAGGSGANTDAATSPRGASLGGETVHGSLRLRGASLRSMLHKLRQRPRGRGSSNGVMGSTDEGSVAGERTSQGLQASAFPSGSPPGSDKEKATKRPRLALFGSAAGRRRSSVNSSSFSSDAAAGSAPLLLSTLFSTPEARLETLREHQSPSPPPIREEEVDPSFSKQSASRAAALDEPSRASSASLEAPGRGSLDGSPSMHWKSLEAHPFDLNSSEGSSEGGDPGLRTEFQSAKGSFNASGASSRSASRNGSRAVSAMRNGNGLVESDSKSSPAMTQAYDKEGPAASAPASDSSTAALHSARASDKATALGVGKVQGATHLQEVVSPGPMPLGGLHMGNAASAAPPDPSSPVSSGAHCNVALDLNLRLSTPGDRVRSQTQSPTPLQVVNAM